MSTEIIRDLTALGKAIKSIKGRHATLDKDIQQAALSAAAAVQEHGNIHYVNALYLALGKGARHAALTAWFQAFGGVVANTGADKDIKPFAFDRNKVVDLEQGDAQPWYDFKPSPKPDEVLDWLAVAMAMLKKKPKEGQEVANEALKARIAKVVQEFNEENAEKADA